METQVLIGVLITLTSSALLGCFGLLLKLIIMIYNHDRQLPVHANKLEKYENVIDKHEMRLDDNDVRCENHEVRITTLEGSKW